MFDALMQPVHAQNTFLVLTSLVPAMKNVIQKA